MNATEDDDESIPSISFDEEEEIVIIQENPLYEQEHYISTDPFEEVSTN